MAKQGEGETVLEQTPGVTSKGGNRDDDDGDKEEEEDDEVSETEIQALQAKHKAAELCR